MSTESGNAAGDRGAQQAEFREYAKRWLAENAPPPPPVRLPRTPLEVMTQPQRDYLQDWQQKCYEAGLVGCDIPKAYGGAVHHRRLLADDLIGPIGE